MLTVLTLLALGCAKQTPPGNIAPTPSSVVEPPCGWAEGTTVVYEVVKQRSDTRKPYLADVRSTTPMTLTVAEVTKRGYRLSLDYGETAITGLPEEISDGPGLALFQAMMRVMGGGFHADLMTDNLLTPTGLADLDALRADLKARMVEVSALLVEESGDPKLAGMMDSMLHTVLDNDAALQQMTLKDIEPLFMTMCGSFEPGGRVEYADTLPNPFGGAPLDSIGAFDIGHPDVGALPVDWSQTLDPETAGDALEDIVAELLGPLDVEAPEGVFDRVDIGDTGHFVVDLAHGWPRSATWQRTIRILDQERVDRLSYALVEGP
ncbi:MAG: hypothetical protein H6739_12375 [Alphaproteobacteria bacterium]|nr:hypothetical protein [Alphaproteobacteria bacterium]